MGGLFGKPKLPRSLSSPPPARFPKNGPSSSLEHAKSAGRYMITPFVFKRWSSMYIDEDGDVAHEFYTESRRSARIGGSQKLRKVDPSDLRPQGYVDYDIPRLHPDIPYIMAEVTCFKPE